MVPSHPGRKARFRALGFAALLVAFLAASCATMRIPPASSSVQGLLAELDRGGYAAGKVTAPAPFLFDGEILALQADVDGVFGALYATGFRFEKALVLSSSALEAAGWSPVSSSMEVRTFIQKRLGPDCSLLRIRAKGGDYLLIVDRGPWGRLRLRGLAGPLS